MTTLESQVIKRLRALPDDQQQAVLYFVEFLLPWQLSEELNSIKGLLKQYESVSMSLADACLVRTAEQFVESKVFTLDGDFKIYRMNRNQIIPVVMPDS